MNAACYLSAASGVFWAFRRTALGVAFCFFLLGSAWADEARVTFTNSVTALPEAAAASRKALAAQALTTQTMDFAVALRMRNRAQLDARLAKGETISRAEMDALYLPLQADYDAVKAWIVGQGFTIRQEDPSRISVFARGTVQQIQASLQTSVVSVTVDSVSYLAAENAPSLPASVAGPVLGINGLQKFHQLHRHIRQPQVSNAAPYLINEIVGAFEAKGMGLTGAGQTIAILIDATPLTTDLSTFWTNNSIQQSLNNVTTINVNNTTITTRQGEETLDAEWTSGIAPAAKIRIYATGSLDDAPLDNGLAAIIGDLSNFPIHQLSISLGLGETDTTASEFSTESQYFATLASQGVSTFVSSGDGSSTPYDGTSKTAPADSGPLQVEYFASDPNVTAVGGTALTLNTSTGVRTGETVWGDTTRHDGGGGGVSIQWAKPTWQVGDGVPTAAGIKRCVPDVSLPADPNTGAYVWYSGKLVQYGGTSWSAPTWAGFCALLNEARALNGKGSFGLLNPSIYALIPVGKSSSGTTNYAGGCFFDITSGNNATGTNAGGKYVAAAAYDQCTGIGSPRVGNLRATLAGAAPAAAPTVTSFSPTSGARGSIVTITGTGFTSTATVSFSGVGATAVSFVSATQITATVPNAAITGPVLVAGPGGSALGASSFTVTASGTAPTITGFTPASGPVGTSVVITGTNFSSVSGVTFGGVGATAYTPNSTTQITATVPTGAATGVIAVTTSAGTATSTASFTVTTTTGGGGGAVVISQIYGAGGISGAAYANDYIELFNSGTTAVDLSNYSVQYAAATGSSWSKTSFTSGTVILPQHYFLVQEASDGAIGASLPAADFKPITTFNLSGTKGKVALVSNQTTIVGTTGINTPGIVDFVGYGPLANESENGNPAPAPSTTTAIFRANGGYTDTNDNGNDFAVAAPTPRNSSVSNPGTSLVSDLTITKTHAASFTQADTGDAYTLTVKNGGTGPTSGTVTVTDTLPAGLTASALSGTGWTIGAGNLSATRSDALPAGSSYPALTLTVNVSSTAAASVTNTAAVSGGGETNTANDSASDVTAITALTPSQNWRYQYFGTTANSGTAADTYVYAGDGLPNLVKYALGLNPLVPGAVPLTVDVATGFLRVSVLRNPNATDIAFGVQVTGDLTNAASWNTNGATVESTSTPSLFQAHDNTPISTAYPRSLRLQITRP